MSKKYKDYLMHWKLGSSGGEWGNHSYIDKIDGRYFYTQEQLQAYLNGARKGLQGAGIRAKNDVAAARNKLSRAISNPRQTLRSATGNASYNARATANGVRARASATRSNVSSKINKIKSIGLNAYSKGLQKSSTLRKADVARQKASGALRRASTRAKLKATYVINGVSYRGSTLRKKALGAWAKTKQRAKNKVGNARESLKFTRQKAIATYGKSKRNIKSTAARTKQRAKNQVGNARESLKFAGQKAIATYGKTKRGIKKKIVETAANSSFGRAVAEAYKKKKNSSSSSSSSSRPRSREKNVTGKGTVEKKGQGLGLGGPVGGKTQGAGLTDTQKRKKSGGSSRKF